MQNLDQHWMQRALALAQKSYAQAEVPVGAVLVLEDKIIGEGWNQPIFSSDPTAHAEVIALRHGAAALKNYRLPPKTTLYVTLEPCVMCLGAIVHSRVDRLVFGALDPKTGSIASRFHLLDTKQFNHTVIWEGGCLAKESQDLLQRFFQARRKRTHPL